MLVYQRYHSFLAPKLCQDIPGLFFLRVVHVVSLASLSLERILELVQLRTCVLQRNRWGVHWGVPKNMDGAFHGKMAIEMDDDCGYPKLYGTPPNIERFLSLQKPGFQWPKSASKGRVNFVIDPHPTIAIGQTNFGHRPNCDIVAKS